ncbi:glycosyltransferase family A protein [Arthrobacter sp. A2-55]|uniref:glycosyltransferase family A protein n=1 Tax=Arthrobacter sp. A2-55 TaxID=2897337 RepID=UPI0021CD3375|nr:glycosyltransferase family 2 protein [Arthrobacter sp. A2-55]MCU6480081.1 glycosyltransferase family 2 protein [Arthrobacter sp. A2-55]
MILPLESIQPAVDLIIAVHSVSRPIDRAIQSVAQAGLGLNAAGGVRINVVCHNIDESQIRAQIREPLRDQVRYLSCRDGIPSPAGPFNAGLDAASAPYVSVMGSDDMLEPGALRQWLEIALRHDSAAVLAPQRHANGAKVRTPPVRVGRSRKLDPVKDRLSYRTAPLGLVQVAEIRRLGLRFTAGYRTGEDQAFSAKLYFGGGRIDYARRAGHYVVGADAIDRVTSEVRPLEDDFTFATELVASDWFGGLPDASQSALVTKLLRVHVFSAAASRNAESWTEADHTALAGVVKVLVAVAPHSVLPLSLADSRLLAAITSSTASGGELMELARQRRKFGTPATLLASNRRSQFKPESPLRFMVASALL